MKEHEPGFALSNREAVNESDRVAGAKKCPEADAKVLEAGERQGTIRAQTRTVQARTDKGLPMPVPQVAPNEVTQLLLDWGKGDESALDKLMPLVYGELRRLARRHLNRERPGQTLQTTDLIHETYLKLVNQHRVKWQNRAQFFGVSAQLMRRILVDRARRKKRMKRGGGAPVVTLDEEVIAYQTSPLDLVAFDEALIRLAEIDPRKAQVVELRFFGGLSVDEAAEFLKVSNITIMRESRMAKAWLHRALSDGS